MRPFSSPAAQGEGGCHCPLLRDWARQRRGCRQPGAQAESPKSPVMGVHGTATFSVCLKHHSYQRLSKLQAPGTSVNQILRSSAGIQRKRKHIYGPPAVKHQGGPDTDLHKPVPRDGWSEYPASQKLKLLLCG